MRKWKNAIIALSGIAICLFVGILIYPQTVKASKKDVDPSIFTYTEGVSSAKSWYDTKSDCFIFQNLEKKKKSEVFYRTFVYEFSRLKSDIDSDPKTNPQYADHLTWEATMDEHDPHVYVGGNRQYYAYEKYAYGYESHFVDLTDGKGEKTTYEYTTFVVDKANVLSCIKSNYPDWYAEYEERMLAGKSMWIGIDSVMTYTDNAIGSVGDGKHYINKGSDITTWLGYIRTYKRDGKTLAIGKTYNWSNWEDIAKDMGLSDTYLKDGDTGIYTDFNGFIEIPADVPDTPEVPDTPDVPDITPDEPPFTPDEKEIIKTTDASNTVKGTGEGQSGSSSASPYIFTYNTDDIFNLGEAIPSSETYTNGIHMFSWYGDAKLKKYRARTTKKFKATLKWEKYMESYTYTTASTDPDMEGYHPETYETWTLESSDGGIYYYIVYSERIVNPTPLNVDLDIPVVADYYGVSSLNLFSYGSSKVTNTFSSTGYDNASTIPYDITINGENKTTGNPFEATTFSGKDDAHVTYPTSGDADLGEVSAPADTFKNRDKLKDYIVSLYTPYQSTWQSEMSATNDTLNINGVTYLDGSGPSFSDSKLYIGAESGDDVTGEKDVTIPSTTANGTYFTSLSATYNRFAAGTGTRTMSITNTETDKKGIYTGYEDNEGISVHTPVSSPISINGEAKTQLTKSAQTAETQLILDNTYTINFDWNKYFYYKGYDDPERFKTYVQNKELRFPFDVQINGTYYQADNNIDGVKYTQWISIGNVDSIKIYIPTWAKEGVYGSDGYTGYDAFKGGIQARVYAINYIDGEQDSWQETANTDKGNYEAVYEYPVQISGVIYDFQIDSINDELLFGGYDRQTGVYSFVTNKEEKTDGVKNRFGGSSMRYALDGLINNDWNVNNTLPFAAGRSLKYPTMGTLSPGHEFGFTLKTISGMYNSDDTIVLKPSFRYISPDGTVNNDVNVYYSEGNTMFKSVYNDKTLNTVRLDSEYFNNCYFDYGSYDPISFTADWFGKNTNAVMRHETASYTYGKITLQSTQKLLTGDEEELYVNRDNESSASARYQGTLGTLNDSVYRQFEASMQTWYGMYHIPDQIYVCDKYADGTDAYAKVIDAKGSIATDDPIWHKDGYLVLTFDITTYVNGKHEHFTYYGGGLDMWRREQGTEDDPSKNTEVTVDNNVKIKVKDGDVAVIDLKKAFSDRYDTGILYIN